MCHRFFETVFTYVDGKKMARNGQKTAIYFAGSFFSK
jgi:hypothetical protein